MIWNKPRGATVYGVDLGKNIFHVVSTDPAGNVIQRVKFRRDTLLRSPWWGWRPAQGRNGWQGSYRRWDIRSGSSRLTS